MQMNISQQVFIRCLLDLCSTDDKVRADAARWVTTKMFDITCRQANINPSGARETIKVLVTEQDLTRRRSIANDAISALLS